MAKLSTYVFAFICCTLFGQEIEHPNSDSCPDGERHARVAVRHIESGGIGYTTGYTTLETFLAADPSWWAVTPFLDARGHIFDNGKWAANAGVGLRALWGKRAYGINTYYDFRNTKRLNYNQIGVGLETLGELFDFRINGYLPLGKKTADPYGATFEEFSGHHMIISQKYQFAMKGADAEFGFHFGESENFDFYAAAGPYYFVGQVGPNTWGGKARIRGTYKDVMTVELTDSYDTTFRNNFQGQIGFSYSFGPKSKVEKKRSIDTCKLAHTMTRRMVQPVGRQEIIVLDKRKLNSAAIDPATGQPYFFVFVNNTSSSNGTIESPYPTLLQAQQNSSPNDVIYVFPGDGTTRGMNSGIILKASQQFLGSGVSHTLPTPQGAITIPPLTSTLPIITNTNIDTEGDAITLATNNTISGFIISSAMHDAIFGTDPQNLEVSSCLFEDTITYAIEATFSDNASMSVTNNQFVNNTNGIFLTLNGTATVICSDNIFTGQTSVSSVPLEITSNSNIFTAHVENNIFNDNTTGSVRFGLTNVIDADILLLNNTITNNGTGSQSSLGSSLTIISIGTNDHCTIALQGNKFSTNTSNALYLHTSGAITALEISASNNTMSHNGGSALVVATPTGALTLVATDNTFTDLHDNGIAAISSGLTPIGNITISNNILANIGNSSNGIAINQDFTTLHLTIQNNEINGCEGTGIVSYAPDGIDSFNLNVSGNTISNCQNLSSNASPGIDIEQYTSLTGSVTNNILSDNTGTAVFISSTLPTPTAVLNVTGNSSSTGYLLTNTDGNYTLNLANNSSGTNYQVTNDSGVFALNISGNTSSEDFVITNTTGELCLNLTGNTSVTGYELTDGGGTFNLSPCNVDSVNVGMINESGVINPVQSCPDATPCPI